MDYIVKIKCDTCGNEFEVDLQEYDITWEVADTFDHGDNAMGEEIHYEAIIDVECPHCNDTITVTLNVWEYPAGSFNNEEITVEGAELIEDCCLQGIDPIGN